jgi:GntR family transcriptional regulator
MPTPKVPPAPKPKVPVDQSKPAVSARTGPARGRARQSPRYAQVAADLTHSVNTGWYAVGAALPSEAQLCKAYDISRFTAREALRRLEQAGLIERNRGRESRVIARKPPPAFMLSVQKEADVLRYAEETSVNLSRSKRKVSAKTMQELELSEDAEWAHFSGVRRDGGTGQPIGTTNVFLRADYADAVKVDSDVSAAIFDQVTSAHGLTMSHIDQVVSATVLPDLAARRLLCEPNEPALRIVRRFSARETGLFEVSVSLHPATRFSYGIRLERPEQATDALAKAT